MKPATVLYIELIDYIRERAKEKGYAVAVHGSMARDLDLLCCPWVESAFTPDELIDELKVLLSNCTGHKWYPTSNSREKKPHRRIAYSLICPHLGHVYIDFSVMCPDGYIYDDALVTT